MWYHNKSITKEGGNGLFGRNKKDTKKTVIEVYDYGSMSDPELVELCAEHNEEAYSEIVKRYEKFVYSAVFAELCHEQDTFDVSQEVFIRLWNAAGGFRCESTLKTWLYRMCKNCAYDYMRKHYKHKTVSLTRETEEDEESTVADIEVGESAEDEVLRKERIAAVRRAISELPPEQRDVIVLRELEGLSYTEIAETLGIGEGTVKSRISRGREALREALSGLL